MLKRAYDEGLRDAMRMVIDEFTLTYPGIKNVEHEYFYAVHGADDATRQGYLEPAVARRPVLVVDDDPDDRGSPRSLWPATAVPLRVRQMGAMRLSVCAPSPSHVKHFQRWPIAQSDA
jgi:hypothetical protein